jgi:hypothetical protein
MSPTNRPVLSEKGLLIPTNCVVALIDLQPQMLFGVSNFTARPSSTTTWRWQKPRASLTYLWC